jgi:hypothetical protein
MQYVLLIYQGTSPRAETLSEEEYQAIAAKYGAINRTPGVTPGLPARASRERHHRAGTGRQDADHRRPLRGAQGGDRRILRLGGRRPRCGDRAGLADPGGPSRWRHRGAPGRTVLVTTLDQGRCCVAPTRGRLKASLGWDQIAKTSSSHATATRRWWARQPPARSVRGEGSAPRHAQR